MQLKQGTFLLGGRYKIERVLGQGGFGITYEAIQVSLNRRVAIKEFFMKEYCNRDVDTSYVSVPSEGSRELVERFRLKFIKEAQTIAGLNHPHIIRIYDIFEENETAYYVMDYVCNGSLSDYVNSHGKLAESEAVDYISQVAEALAYIHERKMSHLDVKPSNILLDENYHAVLIDFGLSKRYDDEGNQTSTTPVGISHGYAPMEQYNRGGVGTFSPTTDVYSLGATLFFLVTGTKPLDANQLYDEGWPPFPKGLSSRVISVIKKTMQPRRKDRPQQIGDFMKILSGKTMVKETVMRGIESLMTKTNREKVKTDETEVIMAVVEHPHAVSQQGDDKNILVGKRHPIVNGMLILIAVMSLYTSAFNFFEIYNNFFYWRRDTVSFVGETMLCVFLLIFSLNIFVNNMLVWFRKKKGVWAMAVIGALMFIAWYMYIWLIYEFYYSVYVVVCQYFNTYYLIGVILFVLTFLAYWGMLQIKYRGRSAWSLMH